MFDEHMFLSCPDNISPGSTHVGANYPNNEFNTPLEDDRNGGDDSGFLPVPPFPPTQGGNPPGPQGPQGPQAPQAPQSCQALPRGLQLPNVSTYVPIPIPNYPQYIPPAVQPPVAQPPLSLWSRGATPPPASNVVPAQPVAGPSTQGPRRSGRAPQPWVVLDNVYGSSTPTSVLQQTNRDWQNLMSGNPDPSQQGSLVALGPSFPPGPSRTVPGPFGA